MRHRPVLSLAVVVVAALTLAASALAQQMGDGPEAQVPKRVERAKRVLIALEAAMARANTADVREETYIAQLDAAIEDARAMTKPVTVAELTDAEREALKTELTADDPAAGDDAESRRQEWVDRALASAFEDAGLSEEEEAAATPVISDWYAGFLAARGERDSKKQSDLKKDRDEALRRLLGRKKANKVINNLNGLGGWGRGR